MLKVADLKSLSVDELKDKRDNLKKELMKFRFEAKLGKLEKQSSIRQTRRDIARVMTVITEKKSDESKKG